MKKIQVSFCKSVYGTMTIEVSDEEAAHIRSAKTYGGRKRRMKAAAYKHIKENDKHQISDEDIKWDGEAYIDYNGAYFADEG